MARRPLQNLPQKLLTVRAQTALFIRAPLVVLRSELPGAACVLPPGPVERRAVRWRETRCRGGPLGARPACGSGLPDQSPPGWLRTTSFARALIQRKCVGPQLADIRDSLDTRRQCASRGSGRPRRAGRLGSLGLLASLRADEILRCSFGSNQYMRLGDTPEGAWRHAQRTRCLHSSPAAASDRKGSSTASYDAVELRSRLTVGSLTPAISAIDRFDFVHGAFGLAPRLKAGAGNRDRDARRVGAPLSRAALATAYIPRPGDDAGQRAAQLSRFTA
jgi:hypothetical protein